MKVHPSTAGRTDHFAEDAEFLTTLPFLRVNFVLPCQEGQGNGANYKGSIDMKAELGRTNAKVKRKMEWNWPERLVSLGGNLNAMHMRTSKKWRRKSTAG